jgi:hypothetical protein
VAQLREHQTCKVQSPSTKEGGGRWRGEGGGIEEEQQERKKCLNCESQPYTTRK